MRSCRRFLGLQRRGWHCILLCRLNVCDHGVDEWSEVSARVLHQLLKPRRHHYAITILLVGLQVLKKKYLTKDWFSFRYNVMTVERLFLLLLAVIVCWKYHTIVIVCSPAWRASTVGCRVGSNTWVESRCASCRSGHTAPARDRCWSGDPHVCRRLSPAWLEPRRLLVDNQRWLYEVGRWRE